MTRDKMGGMPDTDAKHSDSPKPAQQPAPAPAPAPPPAPPAAQLPDEAKNAAGYLNWTGYSEDHGKAKKAVQKADQYFNSSGRSKDPGDVEKR